MSTYLALAAAVVIGLGGNLTVRVNVGTPVTSTPAPTLTLVATNGGAVGDIDGGYTATLTGTNFVGVTGVTFGGVAATAVVVGGPTSLTCTVPAHATGAVSVVVTNGTGSNGANTLFRYFSPAELALTGWWRGSYAGAPWAATASAGVSSTTGNLVTSGNDPTTGTAQNTFTPATCNGTTQYLTNPTLLSTLFTAGAGSIVCLFKASGAAALSGTVYQDAYTFGDTGNGGLAMTFTTSGVSAVFYDGAYKTAIKAQATGSYAIAMMRWDSSNLGCTVNSAAEVQTACGAFATSLASTCAIARGYAGAHFFQGDIIEVLTINTTLSPANYADIKSYQNTRYNLTN